MGEAMALSRDAAGIFLNFANAFPTSQRWPCLAFPSARAGADRSGDDFPFCGLAFVVLVWRRSRGVRCDSVRRQTGLPSQWHSVRLVRRWPSPPIGFHTFPPPEEFRIHRCP